jgi:hypothetical protein
MLPSPSNSIRLAARDDDSLEARMARGEFGEVDGGSTKEQLTRPIRKLLANDPVGLGKQLSRNPHFGTTTEIVAHRDRQVGSWR